MKPVQYQAAVLLGAGHKVSQAAAKLRLHRTTLHLWLKRADFIALVDAESHAMQAAIRGDAHRHERTTFKNAIAAVQAARQKRRAFAHTNKHV